MSLLHVGSAVRVGMLSLEPMRLAGLSCVFDDHPSIQPVTGDLDLLLEDHMIRYLILDVSSNSKWLDTQLSVRRIRPDMRQIILGPPGEEEMILRSITCGARAYLSPTAGPRAIRVAVEVVIQGTIWAPRHLLAKLVDRLLAQAETAPQASASPLFSRRERQVLALILDARSNREIAEELRIEERTVKAYVASLLRKTGSENRVSLSVMATRNQFLGMHPVTASASSGPDVY